MSVQFGRWNIDGKPVDRDYLEKVKPVIASYGPDDGAAHETSSLIILYRPFHTTIESRREQQPHVSESGVVITWDGRLDNRAELIRQLHDRLTISATDVSIVAAAYDEWGADCFAKLIGDWALAIWDAKSRCLLLAKDPIGTRPLYYSIDNDQVTWSTILDPLVLFARKSFSLCEEYIAGWLSLFPAAHLTPYFGIYSVPPSSLVTIRNRNQIVSKYWDFDPAKQIRYRTDSEYEEHFRAAFGEAVRRRLRSDAPILAELSGGMDSSSIVCMADQIIAGRTEFPHLGTVSYYDDSEPNWNERPYFMKVEEKRGRKGCHIAVGPQNPGWFEPTYTRFIPTPACGGAPNTSFVNYITAQGCRVVLSGTGGDEVMGGVPTPIPELQDLLTVAQFRVLAHQLKAWALNKRRPWLQLLFEAIRGFLPAMPFGIWNHKQPAPWFVSSFVKRNQEAFHGYKGRTKLLGALPSFQENLSTLDALRRQLISNPLPAEPPFEKRYPYLDRGLLEFIYAIPREQLVRPGQRRSLARRALAGIVPDELLNRKRKASVSRGPLTSISKEWPRLIEISRDMKSASYGFVNANAFFQTLERARVGQEVPLVRLLRTVGVELWLRNVSNYRAVIATNPRIEHVATDAASPIFSAEKT